VDLKEIIAQLREERARVTQAILAIEAVAERRNSNVLGVLVKRPRGRPPGSRNKPKLTLTKKTSRHESNRESSGTEG
jgi:ribulose bisphosphate carboxylase small subunit